MSSESQQFDANCCQNGHCNHLYCVEWDVKLYSTQILPVPDRVKLSFVIFDIRALWRCTAHMATVSVKGLNVREGCNHARRFSIEKGARNLYAIGWCSCCETPSPSALYIADCSGCILILSAEKTSACSRDYIRTNGWKIGHNSAQS